MRCPDPQRHELWTDSANELEVWLIKCDTDPVLRQLVVTFVVGKWCMTAAQSDLDKVTQLIDALGWDAFMEGKIPTLLVNL